MKHNTCLIITTFVISLFFQNKINSQDKGHDLDGLTKMSINQFDNWLISLINKEKPSKTNVISDAICERKKNNLGVSSDAITHLLGIGPFTHDEKVNLIERILPCCLKDKVLNIDLLHMQLTYMTNDSIYTDSTFLNKRLDLHDKIEKENTRLIRIQYTNYVKIGKIYLNKYGDKEKAIDFFMKAKRIPFYTYQDMDDMQFFKNIYVEAAIGQIWCFQGDYLKLKALQFIPSTYADILPTYKRYIEGAGGRCELCDEYLKDYRPRDFAPLPPPNGN